MLIPITSRLTPVVVYPVLFYLDAKVRTIPITMQYLYEKYLNWGYLLTYIIHETVMTWHDRSIPYQCPSDNLRHTKQSKCPHITERCADIFISYYIASAIRTCTEQSFMLAGSLTLHWRISLHKSVYSQFMPNVCGINTEAESGQKYSNRRYLYHAMEL